MSQAGSLSQAVTNGFIFTPRTAWTPVLYFGNATTGITYTTQEATYVRLGDVAFINIQIFLNSKGSATGGAAIRGFPLSLYGDSELTASWSNITLTGTASVLTPFISNSPNYLVLDQSGTSGNPLPLSDTAFANNTFLAISGCVNLA